MITIKVKVPAQEFDIDVDVWEDEWEEVHKENDDTIYSIVQDALINRAEYLDFEYKVKDDGEVPDDYEEPIDYFEGVKNED